MEGQLSKIKRVSSLAKITARLKKDGKRIVLCHGVFDLVHPGHVRHFASARNHGDVLIVTITADKFVNKGPGRPIFRQELRAEVLAAIAFIDYIAIVNSGSAVDAIRKIRPDYYVKGPDYRNRKPTPSVPRKLGEEEKAVLSVGGQLIFTDDAVIYSSSKIISDYLEVYPPRTKRFLTEMKRKYTSEKLIADLTKLKKLKILVIGDAIIDQYHYCLPMGKSSKEPVMVHRYVADESYMGGVLATVNHLSSLSRNLTLLTVLGKKNSFRSFITRRLRPQVKPVFLYQSKDPTIIKRRFLDLNNRQKLFQISYLHEDFVLPEQTEKLILGYLKKELPKFDLVVVNDYGHGMMTPKTIRHICRHARYIALNVQTNSANFGFNVVTKYPRADFVCIDNQEIRLATQDRFSDLTLLIRSIQRKLKCSFMIVTKGPYGAVGYSQQAGFVEVPALTDRIVDRVGAGDALFAIASPCVYAGMPPDVVTFMGNVAGALKVQVIGNKKQIEFVDLAKYITRLLK
ncbi:hypothetical protein A2Z33_04055 [Candidatus Gottesmanbacteria bacterium RBG_16_52_11]|uniref:Cytidyltransferase n=1 Tax=Candidatus Gottesmanbacteria bacterium RBG_16_52_11 TaxID=1798374 RepID=A0A1F5YVZ7_9BACT|nr:MAG: hypothetical protein A2Z33_04055 [Candidatus Gottesmanbacteria bacterium RBG_16_52_11]